jgi:hypothetical protein
MKKLMLVVMILALGVVSSHLMVAVVLPVPGGESATEKPLYPETGEAELPVIDEAPMIRTKPVSETGEAELKTNFIPEIGLEEQQEEGEPQLLGPYMEEEHPGMEKPLYVGQEIPSEEQTAAEVLPEGYVNYPLPETKYPEEYPMAVEPFEQQGMEQGGDLKAVGGWYGKHGKGGKKHGGKWKKKREGWKKKHMTPEQRKQKREGWKKKHMTPEQQKQWEQKKKEWEEKRASMKPEEFKKWKEQKKEEWRKKKQ